MSIKFILTQNLTLLPVDIAERIRGEVYRRKDKEGRWKWRGTRLQQVCIHDKQFSICQVCAPPPPKLIIPTDDLPFAPLKKEERIKGTIYQMNDKHGRWRWNGKQFHQACAAHDSQIGSCKDEVCIRLFQESMVILADGSDLPLAPSNKEDRVKNNVYRRDDKDGRWKWCGYTGHPWEQVCQHNRYPSQCTKCGTGSGICEHGKRRDNCTKGSCGMIPSKRKCVNCISKLVRSGTKICAECKIILKLAPPTRIKQHELNTEALLNKHGIEFTHNKHVPFDFNDEGGGTKSRAFIDFDIIRKDECRDILETDERQHSDYDVSCDAKRMADIYLALTLEGNTLPVTFIRYNPDSYKVNGVKRETPREVREAKLIEYIQNYKQRVQQPLSIVYFYYNTTDGSLDISRNELYSPELAKCITDVFY